MQIQKSEIELLIKNLFKVIPDGAVEMRDDRTKHTWMVEIPSFQMARFPVTQELYAAVTGETPSTFKEELLPVESISWLDAVTFCNKLSSLLGRDECYILDVSKEEIGVVPGAKGFRLPTEAEWQYACMAGDRSIRYGELDAIAWFKDNSAGSTQQVGQKQPNEWGLYDMLGNVWEWCADIYDEEVYGSYRIFRGGGWCDQERSVMATTRRRSHPFSFKIDDLGFRLASDFTSEDLLL